MCRQACPAWVIVSVHQHHLASIPKGHLLLPSAQTTAKSHGLRDSVRSCLCFTGQRQQIPHLTAVALEQSGWWRADQWPWRTVNLELPACTGISHCLAAIVSCLTFHILRTTPHVNVVLSVISHFSSPAQASNKLTMPGSRRDILAGIRPPRFGL